MRTLGATRKNFKQIRTHPTMDFLWRVIVVLIGDVLGAISVKNFLQPANILAGGVTGIAQIIQHYIRFFGIGTLFLILNVPLFILGYRYLGRRFIALTGIGIVGFSVFTDLLHFQFVHVQDPLLMALYGGVVGGLSSGIVIRVGGSQGGTDILSLVVHRISGRSVGSTGFLINIAIVGVSALIFGIPAGMYTLVAMFATSRVINALMHYQQRKTALIVTSQATEMSRAIGDRLGRGSTLMNASGAYTNSTLGVLMCALTHLELAELKELIQDIDPNAFMTILDTTEVMGKFKNLPI